MRYSCLLCRPVTLVTSVFLAQVTSQCQSWHGSQTQVTPLPQFPKLLHRYTVQPAELYITLLI